MNTWIDWPFSVPVTIRSLFSEGGHRGKTDDVTLLFPFAFLTSHFSCLSNHSGHACYYAVMNNFQDPLLCAPSRYWYFCSRHQMNLYRLSLPLGISHRPLRTVLIPLVWETLPLPPAKLRITWTCKPLHHGRLEIPLKKTAVRVNIRSIALCGAEAWALAKVD